MKFWLNFKHSSVIKSCLIFLFLVINLIIPTDFKSNIKAQSIQENLIYTDHLNSGWQNWSWGASINFDNPAPVIQGSKSIWLTLSSWGALYLHNDNSINLSTTPNLHFNLHVSHTNAKYQLLVYGTSNQLLKSISLDLYGLPTPFIWKNYDIDLNNLGATDIKGIAIQDTTGLSNPQIFIDDIKFTSTANSTSINNNPTHTITPTAKPIPTPTLIPTSKPTILPTLTPVATITPTPTIPNTGSINSNYTVSGGKVFKNGNQITLKGVNWFGSETGTFVFHGLWSRNYKEMISQIKSLGFNAVRVPVCPATLSGVSPNSIDFSKNSDLLNLNSLQVLDKILNEVNNQGLYILIDHHTPDCNTISDLWYTQNYSENNWISDLKFIASHFSKLQNFIGIDLKNEPHNTATWGTGNITTDWNIAAEKAAKEVLSSNQNLIIFIEGIGENPKCSSTFGHFWGENLEPFKCAPISNSVIPSNKLVLSPHIYGPDVYPQSYFYASNFPNNMASIWETQFGFLTNQNKTLIPGEWGGKYGSGPSGQKDVLFQNELVNYLKQKGICNSFYWSWNPNSGDTGGILMDDWATPNATKLNLLQNFFKSCQ